MTVAAMLFRKRNSLVALCILLAIAQGCDPPLPADNFKLEHEVFPQPARVGSVTIKLKLTDPLGKPVTGALLTLEGNMSHSGMSPVFAEAKETEPGRYQTTLELSMAGDWFVLVNAKLSDASILGRKFEIKGVAPV